VKPEFIVKKLNEAVSKYIDLKDFITENEITQVVGDSVNVVKFVNSATRYISNKRMMSFLNGLSINEQLTESEISKLTDYIDNEEKAEYIANAFSKVFQSNSNSACYIMGKILSSVIEKGETISHEELIAFNTLTYLFDKDIENLKILLDFFDEEAYSERSLPVVDIRTTFSYLNYINQSQGSMYLTIEKLLSNGIIFKIYEANTDFSKTEVRVERESYWEVANLHNPPQTHINEKYELSTAGIVLEKIINSL